MPDVKRDPELWRRRFVLDPMRRLQRAIHRQMLHVVAAEGYPGIRVQHLDVFALVPRDEGMRMSELADRLRVTPGAVTQLVAQLEAMGLVRRHPDRKDGRAVLVRPTAAAEAGYEAGRRFLAELEREWERAVGPRRWATFKAVLAEIVEREEARAEEDGEGGGRGG